MNITTEKRLENAVDAFDAVIADYNVIVQQLLALRATLDGIIEHLQPQTVAAAEQGLAPAEQYPRIAAVLGGKGNGSQP